jgi:CRISPR system Cascade subunit CasA
MPSNEDEQIERHERIMSYDEYLNISEQFSDRFSIDAKEAPFMQNANTKENITGIQKLLVGLPGGGSVTMFVPPDEITKICPSCAAIALYNLASGAPSFGGGFKAPLRGSAPISVLIYNSNLRKMIWENIIPKNSDWYESMINTESLPVWKKPIIENSSVNTNNIGIMRGLFWQPTSVLMKWEEENGVCDCCGLDSDKLCYEFDKQQFRYELSGMWWHPHSSLKISKEKRCYVPSFHEEAPAWEQLSELFPENRDGERPPAVIENYSKVFLADGKLRGLKQKITLSIGGYINDQASIRERHHHLVPLSNSLLSSEAGIKNLRLLLDTAIKIKACLKDSIKKFFKIALNSKNENNYGFVKKAEKMFFLQSEHLIRESLSFYNDDTLLNMISELKKICEPILEETATPWLANLLGEKAFLSSKNTLAKCINKIKLDFENGGKNEPAK